MKKGRIILSIVLIALIGGGWTSQVMYAINQTKNYKTVVVEADICREKKLYQKAIDFYDEALKIKENNSVRNKWLETYRLAYEAEEITRDKYLNAMKQGVEIYPKRADIWETLIIDSLNKMDFKGAKKYYENALKAGADKEIISKYKNEIYYSVSENNRIFSTVLMSSQGYFTVFDGKKWGVMDSAGEWVYECTYDYAGPVINNDMYFLTTSKDSRIYNKAKVAQAILEEQNISTKAIDEGVVPICKNGIWTFYDYVREENILDRYDNVSCFINGKAAVKNGGTWRIIDKSGKDVCDKKFDDVKLLGSGEYAFNGIMIAAYAGKYGIYDESGKSKCDFTAKDMDICMGGKIAYMDSTGKWGFIDNDGKIVIEPKFDEAKSFSNGLAAVKLGDNWGFINERGELVIDYKYSDGGYFTNNGVCFVGLSNKQMYMITLRF